MVAKFNHMITPLIQQLWDMISLCGSHLFHNIPLVVRNMLPWFTLKFFLQVNIISQTKRLNNIIFMEIILRIRLIDLFQFQFIFQA